MNSLRVHQTMLDFWMRSCEECGRTFDLRQETEAEELYYGHDCEEVSA